MPAVASRADQTDAVGGAVAFRCAGRVRASSTPSSTQPRLTQSKLCINDISHQAIKAA